MKNFRKSLLSKVLSSVLSVLIVFTMMPVSFADENTSSNTEQTETQKDEKVDSKSETKEEVKTDKEESEKNSEVQDEKVDEPKEETTSEEKSETKDEAKSEDTSEGEDSKEAETKEDATKEEESKEAENKEDATEEETKDAEAKEEATEEETKDAEAKEDATKEEESKDAETEEEESKDAEAKEETEDKESADTKEEEAKSGKLSFNYKSLVPAQSSTEVQIGEKVVHKAQITSEVTEHKDVYAEFKISKENVIYESIKLEEPVKNATFKVLDKDEDKDNYIAVLHISKIEADKTVTAKLSYKLDKETTEDNYKKKVSLELKDSDKNTVGKPIKVENTFVTEVKNTEDEKEVQTFNAEKKAPQNNTKDNGSILFNYETLNPADPNTAVYTGETVVHRARIENSGQEAHNIVAEIKIPKEYVVYNSIQLANLVTNGTFELLPSNTDPDNYVGRLTISQIDSGTSIFPKFSYRLKSGITPDNYTKTVSLQVIEEDGTSSGDPVSVTNKFKTVKPKQTLKQVWHNNSHNWSSNVNVNDSMFAGTSTNGTVDPATAQDVVFRYLLLHDSTHNSQSIGVRDYSKVTVKDTIPDGAVFDPAKNPGWTYDAATRTATYVYDKAQSGTDHAYYARSWTAIKNNGNTELRLKLSFENENVTNPDGSPKKYTNDVELTLDVDDPHPGETAQFTGIPELTDDVDFYLNTSSPGGYSVGKTPVTRYYIDVENRLQDDVLWNLSYSNPSETISNLVLTDHTLDANLEYVGVRASNVNSNRNFGTATGVKDGKFNVTLVFDDNTEMLAGEFDPYDANAEILFDNLTLPAGKEIKKVKLTPSDASYKAWPNSYLALRIITRFKDPAASHVPGNADFANMFNRFRSEGYVEEYGLQGTVRDNGNWIRVYAYRPTLDLAKENSIQSGSFLNYGSEVGYKVYLREQTTKPLLEGDTVQTNGNKVLDILPPGLTYVPGSTTINYPHAQADGTNDNIFTTVEPSVSYNSTTNQVTLVWNYGKDLVKVGDQTNTVFFTINYKAKVTDFAQAGPLTNKVMTIWDNNNADPNGWESGKIAHSGNTPDTNDLDGDGNTTEELAYRQVNITLSPPNEVKSFKEIQDTVTGGWSSTGTFINPKEDFKYNFTIRNNTSTTVPNIKLIDKIPYVGDTSIVEGTARGSMFDVVMSPAQATVTIPYGYKVYYNPSTSATYNGGGWVEHSAVTDFTVMRVVKIESEPGVSIGPNSTLRFPIIVRTQDSNIDIGEGYLTEDMIPKAYNDFAKFSGSGNFIDVNRVYAKYFYFNMSGKAFNDLNGDDLYDSNDEVFSNITVELLNSDGSPVLDDSGNPVTTNTDANGNYKFKVYSSGSYKVKFNVPSGYAVLNDGDIGETTASHIDNSQVSKTFSFDTTKDGDTYVNSYYVVNGGFRGATYTLTKELKDEEGNVVNTETDFTFNLSITDSNANFAPLTNLAAKLIRIVDGLSTDLTVSDGDDVIIKNGYKLVIANLVAGIKIIATELNADDYDTEIDGVASQDKVSTVTTTAGQTDDVKYTNNRRAKYTLVKELKDVDGNTITDGRVFTFSISMIDTANNAPVNNKPAKLIHIATGNSSDLTVSNGDNVVVKNGYKLVIDGVDAGIEFVVTELNADDYDTEINGVASSDKTSNVTTTGQSVTTTFTNKEKALGAINITKSLLDSSGNAITEEREFTVKVTGPSYPTGQEFTLKNTDDGKINLSGLEYGEYTVEELGASNYTVTNGNSTFTLSIDEKTKDITIINAERSEGAINITKTLTDVDGNVLVAQREFTVKVTGPSYPAGQEFTIKNGANGRVNLTGLIYGEYTVEELNTDDYEVTNGNSTVTISLDNKTADINITNKEKAIGAITITKEVIDADFNVITEEREFTVKVTGPSYPTGQEFTLRNSEAGKITLVGLKFGNYAIEELGASDDYEMIDGSQTLSVNILDKEVEFEIVNKEKAQGKLTITKKLLDAKENAIGEAKEFEITVTGPSYPDGEVMTITNANPLVLEGLKYGTYSVVETEDGNYVTTQAEDVTLDIENKEASLEIINVEGNLGSLLINKILLDSEGEVIEEAREFEITVTGPSFPEGKVMTVTNGTLLKLTGLEYGTYSVVETDDLDYVITQAGDVTLDINNKQAEVQIVNQEKPKGSVLITNTVVDDNGNEIDPGTEFEVTITGPSFPDGKVFTIITGQDVEFTDLIFGEYSVVQTEHSKYTTTQALNKTIFVGKKHARFDILNKRTAKKSLPKTGTDEGNANMLAGISIILIGLYLFRRKKITI